jgi:hypothetical protein
MAATVSCSQLIDGERGCYDSESGKGLAVLQFATGLLYYEFDITYPPGCDR